MADELTTWKQWVVHHGRVFGFNDGQILMADSWRDVFTASGYSLDELGAATKALAADPPEKPWDHLGAIHEAIRSARSVAYRLESEVDEYGECTLCGNGGFVVVPHPKGIKDGEWVPIKTTRAGAGYYTAAVLCSCQIGRRKAQRLGKDRNGQPRTMMTLENYQALNPDWRRQMESRGRQARAVAEVSRQPGKLDQWWDAFKKRLADKFRIR